MDMSEAVNTFAGVRGNRRHQFLVFRFLSQIIGHTHRIHGGAQDGIVHGILHRFTKHIHPEAQVTEALDILLASHQCHNNRPF